MGVRVCYSKWADHERRFRLLMGFQSREEQWAF